MSLDAFRDGFVRLCIDPSLNVLGEGCRVVFEGQYFDPGASQVTADTLVKVTSRADIDANFGAGSVLAESLKVALECCGSTGVEFFAIPRADAAGSTAAVYEMTVTGAATTTGRVDIFWGDSRYNLSAFIDAGATDAQVAAAIAAEVLPDFPYTVAVAANVITLTAKNAGTVGNYLNPSVNWHGRNNYLPEGVTFATAQTVVGAGDPEGIDYVSLLGECCVCAYGMLFGNNQWQNDVIAYLEDAWDCSKPQCFGHGYTYNAGSLGAVLVGDTNSATVNRMALPASTAAFPYLMTAAYTTASACRTIDSPEVSIQGPNFGVLDCIRVPESCDTGWSFAEREQLEASGFVVTVPVSAGQGNLTSPMIVSDITNNRTDAEGRPNLTFRSTNARRLATETARQIAEQLQQYNGLGYYTANTSIREGAQGANKNLILGGLRTWVRSQVGVLFSEFDNLDTDLTVTDDFETAPRCLGIPGELAVNLTYRPPVRIAGIKVNAQPLLLDNC